MRRPEDVWRALAQSLGARAKGGEALGAFAAAVRAAVRRRKVDRVALLIDEFDKIFLHRWHRDFCDNLNSLLFGSPAGSGGYEDGVSDLYAVCVAGAHRMQELMVDETSPLASRLTWCRLFALDADDVGLLAREPGGREYPARFCLELHEESGGHPALAQALLRELWGATVEESTSALPEALERVGTGFSAMFEAQWKNLPDPARDVFGVLARRGSLPLRELATLTHLAVIEVRPAVEVLEASGIASLQGPADEERVRATNRLFLRWAAKNGVNVERGSLKPTARHRAEAWEAFRELELCGRAVVRQCAARLERDLDDLIREALGPEEWRKVDESRQQSWANVHGSRDDPATAYLVFRQLGAVLRSSVLAPLIGTAFGTATDVGEKLKRINEI